MIRCFVRFFVILGVVLVFSRAVVGSSADGVADCEWHGLLGISQNRSSRSGCKKLHVSK